MLLAVSIPYEAHFLQRGLNMLDEGWPLYAAMRLHAGGSLYQDVLWAFPPGHVLPAWIGFWLDPPGVEITRAIYGAFDTVLCILLYLLGRRLMPARFAFLGALLMAVAAPRSHLIQTVFGHRYLALTALSLLAFSRRLRTGDPRWMFAAGLCAGVALFFRLTPAFAVSCGVAAGSVVANRAWRSWLTDWSWYAAGLLLVIAPVLAWFAHSVGVETLWREVVVHPLAMLQAKPVPNLVFPRRWARDQIAWSFFTIQIRLYSALYLGYAAVLLYRLRRSVLRRQPFEHTLLLAVVIWGAIYFLRAFGRADEPHLDSALPPVCLLLGHLASVGFRAIWARWPAAPRRRHVAEVAACAVALFSWVFLIGTDDMLTNPYWNKHRGMPPYWQVKADNLRKWTAPDETILDLSASPMLYVISGRTGPGYYDIVMPGTFLKRVDELRFIKRLRESPPMLVIWPMKIFDRMSKRGLRHIAPALVRWVLANYEVRSLDEEYAFMFRKGADSTDWPPVIPNPLERRTPRRDPAERSERPGDPGGGQPEKEG